MFYSNRVTDVLRERSVRAVAGTPVSGGKEINRYTQSQERLLYLKGKELFFYI